MVAAVLEARSAVRQMTPPFSIMAVKALADPQTLAKLTGIIAQFGVIPVAFSCQRSGNYLLIDFQFSASNDTRVDMILAKVQSMITVERATMICR